MRHSILPVLLGLVVTQVARSQGTSPGEIATVKLGDRQDARLVAFSPDGRLLALAGEYSDIRIWDVATARRLYTLKGHSSAITFSPDGKLLASATASAVLLWDVQSGKQQGKLEASIDFKQIFSLAFRPDGKRLVGAGNAWIVGGAGLEEFTAVISWDAGTRKMIGFDKVYKEYTDSWLSADGGTVACLARTEGGQYFLRVRDLANKTEFDLSSKEAILDKNKWAAALSPDGKVAAIGDKLWDVTTRKQLVILGAEPFDTISYLSFSPDGKFVAAVGMSRRISKSGKNATIGLYKVKTGDVVFAFNAHHGEIYSLAITRNGQTMASVSEDKTVKLWDLDP
jgi:WD40 repeat protein